VALVTSWIKKLAILCARKVLRANMIFETLLRRNSSCSVNLKVELTTTPSTVSRFSLVMRVGGGRGSLVSLKRGKVIYFDTLSFRLLNSAQSQICCISLCKRCELTDGTIS